MQDSFFVNVGKRLLKISFSEILYIEAARKYVYIFTTAKKYLILASMCSAERILPRDQFCRIHRSYIVSLKHTSAFDNESVYIADQMLPIGKQYRESLQKCVIIFSGETVSDESEERNGYLQQIKSTSHIKTAAMVENGVSS